MKKLILSLTTVAALALLVATGCSKSNDVDTSKVQTAFQSAQGADKTDIDQAVSSIKAGDYPAALSSLQKAAANAKLTPEQKTAIQDVVTQIQNKLAEVAKKAGEEASKSVSDLQKSLPK